MRKLRNRADAVRYLLNPREVERRTDYKGNVFRIYDDGNYLLGHIFSIEKLKMYGKTEVWKRVSDLFIDWSDVSKEMKHLCIC